ncbi:MAG: LacI family DNA-binding transcriptional regulator [Eubacterium sp.]|nr:LacI family DNA-binding transcriptional regulator [Eubacterium sp.]
MTIKEVARLAGVSSAAVSRYFNGGSLSEEKREQIRKVVEKTDYTPNAAAHLMRTGRSRMIGVIVPHIHSDSLSQISSGIMRALDAEGYSFILGYTGGDTKKEVRIIEEMQHAQMEGILLMGTVMNRTLRETIDRCKVPLVVTGQCFDGVPSVYHDDENALRKLTGLMLKKNRKHLAYIGVTETDAAAGLSRRKGVEKAFKDFGREKSELIRGTADFSVESGHSVMEELLKEHPEIDGVICATDLIAHGAMRALREAGKKIPKDVAVAGVGDHWADEASAPPLTTVKLFFRECGKMAVELLFKLIREKEEAEGVWEKRKDIQVKLGYTIVERGSL